MIYALINFEISTGIPENLQNFIISWKLNLYCITKPQITRSLMYITRLS